MQCIHTIDGYAIPLTIRNGLPYMQLHLYTNMEWEELPDVYSGVMSVGIQLFMIVYSQMMTVGMMMLLILPMMIIVDVFDQCGFFKPDAVNSPYCKQNGVNLWWATCVSNGNQSTIFESITVLIQFPSSPYRNYQTHFWSNYPICKVCMDSWAYLQSP